MLLNGSAERVRMVTLTKYRFLFALARPTIDFLPVNTTVKNDVKSSGYITLAIAVVS